ncbi:flagellin FliC [Shewanella yunxiaonensis]|uniref:Flagellin n=1 Tax=Shewanella yunxiaonensis TaxID=2829809 RepID=A0ABX7YXF7_9GAMM|nr:flagellin [Shewanella yunxiaonensis]QUN06846.1 flagellin FliC [Shewanella yunxiaonensis]
MAITVNTNVTSMKAQKNLNATGNALATSMERLSSGLRINSAKDDAAGLAISDRLNSQVRGLDVGMRNANDVISVAQIAEGAMQEQTNMLQRMRDLSVQATNGANSSSDIAALQSEYNALASEIDAIGTNTAFGNTKLLDGSFASKTFQTGHTSAENISISIADMSTLGSDAAGTVGTATLALVDTQIAAVDAERANLGAIQNRMSYNISNSANTQANVADAKSRIVDVDFAKETSAMTKSQVLQQTGAAMLSQANQLPQIALSLM